MAFGMHWEWRGFGVLSSALEDKVRALVPLFPDSQVVTDRYLWSPGCSINFKLRFGDFKIKRCLEQEDGGVAKWQEDPGENYSFPLAGGVLGEVVSALGGTDEGAGDAVESEAELLDRAGLAIAGLQVVAVAKERWQYGAPVLEGGIIELAQISLPEEIISVSVEHESAEGVREIMEVLGLPGELKSFSYLEALETWGNGGTFAG
ncbi:MAG: hypothetical protein VX496_04955 [Planctomycetota bacterium]|nr:hypothetical protein [Planctomycetota bacterium]